MSSHLWDGQPLERGLAIIRSATRADRAGRHQEAIPHYMAGLELLQLAIRRACAPQAGETLAPLRECLRYAL